MLKKNAYILLVIMGFGITSFMMHQVHYFGDEDFKRGQLNNTRVLSAYQERIDSIDHWLLAKNLSISNYEVLIRAFKKEDLVEMWVKNYDTDTFALFKTYRICSSSGLLGPKRRRGDQQIPEGVYYINEFNPLSNYHLSLGLNYPNKSDSILGEKGNWGDDIYIHGGCESVGCLPITTRRIKEFYVMALQARYFGQKRIPVLIFPCKLTNYNYKQISKSYNNPKLTKFWGSLRSLYSYFESFHSLPNMRIEENGNYYFYAK